MARERTLLIAMPEAGRHAEAIHLPGRVTGSEMFSASQHPYTVISRRNWRERTLRTARARGGSPLLESATPILKKQLGRELLHACLHASTCHRLPRRRPFGGSTALHVETLAAAAEGPRAGASTDPGFHDPARQYLYGAGRYAEAEPLLLAAHKGYAKRDAVYPTPYDHAQAREACRNWYSCMRNQTNPTRPRPGRRNSLP